MPRSIVVLPTRDEMPRRAPDVWIHEDGLGDDFFAYMGVPSAFRDSPATVVEHDALFFDTSSKIALDVHGEIIRANLPMIPDSPRLMTQVARMREQIGAGHVIELAEPGPFALLASPRHDNYFHFLFDDLGRLGFYDALEPLTSARFPVPRPRPWQRQLYRLAGIEPRLRELPAGVVALRNIWVAPRGLAKIDEFRGRAFDRVQAVGERVPAARPGPRRIYVSREGTRHRRLLNEREARALVGARGFHIVQPHTMPVADQIHLFRGADVTLGVCGAGLANAAFMRPGSLLLEIAPTRRATPPVVHNASFASMAGSGGLRYGLLSAPSRGVDQETHDFAAPIQWLEQLLNRTIDGTASR